jgi:hypothetical protein
MAVWDDFVGFFVLVALIALICSSVFWGLASGSLAIKAKSKRPLLHFALGAVLQFVWFFVVAILALVALAKGKGQSSGVTQLPSDQIADVNKGFEEW